MTCKHHNTRAEKVPAPHFNKLVCNDCGKFIKWLGKNYRHEVPDKQRVLSDVGVITKKDSLGRDRSVWF